MTGEDAALPAPPDLPARLPLGLTGEALDAWAASVEALGDDESRVRAAAEELAACEALCCYVRAWRRHHAARMYVAGYTIGVIASAANVADSFVSRQVRKLGLPPRRGGKNAT